MFLKVDRFMYTIPVAVPFNVLSVTVKGISLAPSDTIQMLFVSLVPSRNS